MRLIDADALKEQVCLDGDCTQCKTGVNEKLCKWNMAQLNDVMKCLEDAPTIDAVPVVRCKDCKWYDPPHIDHGNGKRTDVADDAPFVPISVGINVGGKCMNTLREYCCNHDREDPDDYERLVKFRNRMDYCSDGERKDDE